MPGESAATAYENLVSRSREVALINSCTSVLGWDQETHMPAGGAGHRAAQLSHLSSLAHERWTDPAVGDWLGCCGEAPVGTWTASEAGNLREWARGYRRASRIPARLVAELSRTCSLAHGEWVEARKASDFRMFAPRLRLIVGLVRELADAVGYAEDPYEALLDEYEPGMRTRGVAGLFDDLAPRLAELIPLGEANSDPAGLPPGPYPVALQREFNRRIAEAFGFDFGRGRIDTAVHPFCSTLGPGDVRLTTRYDERDFTDSLYSVIHETGHGLYEQGLEASAFGTPAGSAASLGIHESQSRLWENHVARGPAFWEFTLPIAAEYFPQLAKCDPAQISRAVNRCRRSFIRVESDAIAYDAHIILRFRVETAVINEGLPVEEIPDLWNAEFKSLFGLEVPDDARGCLQDVHWSHGSFGYFPTYTLGNLNAAQLMEAARRAIPGLEDGFARGGFAPLLEWLRETVHRHGMTLPPGELMERATGTPTSPAAHLGFLARRASVFTPERG